jgi:hypothetical protein
MADDVRDAAAGAAAVEHPHFGTCCHNLKEAMSGADFEPLITVGEDDVLYMAVGLIDIEEDEPGMVDHPLFFCPFCGSGLQTPDEVKAKVEKSGSVTE